MTTRRQALFANAMRNSAIALRSYQWGWHIDPERQAQIAKEIQQGIGAADVELKELLKLEPIPEDFAAAFNPNSSQQCSKLLYDILDEPVRIRTPEGNPSSGKDALEKIKLLAEEPAKSIATVLRQRKILAKLDDAYIKNLSGLAIVRPNAHVTAQLSGRWSYKDPATQTTPTRIKPMFIARPGCRMVACDLAGAEYRTMALLSGDAGMLEAFNAGKDLHARTAHLAWGCSVEDSFTKPFRNPAKTLGLGTHYSTLDVEGAAMGLYHQLIARMPNITYEEVRAAVVRLMKERPRVFEYKAELLADVMVKDYVEEPLNKRRRKFWDRVKDTDAYNFPHQAMIAAIVDRAIQAIDAELDHTKEGLLLQRHDELILEGPDPIRLVNLLYQHMRQTHSYDGNSITFEVDFWIGRRWGEGGCSFESKEGKWITEPRDGRDKQVFEHLDQAAAYAVAA